METKRALRSVFIGRSILYQTLVIISHHSVIDPAQHFNHDRDRDEKCWTLQSSSSKWVSKYPLFSNQSLMKKFNQGLIENKKPKSGCKKLNRFV
jgi:hypothetical protein